MNLKSRAIKGTFWSVLSGMLNHIIQLISFVILGRLLFPQDFGLMAYATFFIAAIRMFTDFGLGYALIQKSNPTENEYNVVFTFSILVAITLSIIMFFGSFVISDLANEPELTPILKIICFIYLIDSINIVPSTKLTKQLLFKKLFISQTAGTVSYAIVAIPLAYLGFKTYSLVYGFLISSLLTTISTYLFAGWKIKFEFDFKKAKGLLKFGVYQSGASFLNYFTNNLERFFLGKYLGAQDLGLYHFSMRIISIPQVAVSQNIGKVVFPAFSEIQENISLLKDSYLKLINYLLYLSLPVLVLTAYYADIWIPLIFGVKWLDAVYPFRILMAAGILAAVSSPLGNVYLAKGKSNYTFYMTLLLLITSVLTYTVSINYGFIILCYGVVFYRIINTGLIIFYCEKILKLRINDYMKIIYKPILITLLLMVSNFLINQFIFNSFAVLVIIKISLILFFNFAIIYLFLINYEKGLLSKINDSLKIYLKEGKILRIINLILCFRLN